MNDEVERLSDELREELAANNMRRLIDPRSVPVRFTFLKAIDKSPAHYVHAVQNHREETLCLRMGIGTHAITFGTPEVVMFKARRAGKVWEAFEAANEGKVILNEREHSIATAMARSLTTDMVADPLLFAPGTRHEHAIEWMIGGRKCTGRLDALGPAALCDLKAVKDADPRWFGYQVRKNGWHAQLAWYRDGAERAGYGSREPYFVAVENVAPYVVTVIRLSDKDYRAGQDLYRRWFERVIECEAKNYWPGYVDRVIESDVPESAPAAADDSTESAEN